jgi:hypothetical protein
MGNVALAVNTLVWVRETERLAEAVELATVPARPVLVAVVLAPLCGLAVTWTVVPRGTLAALRATWTGLVVPVGKRMSGTVRKLPLGLAGAATPATLAMDKEGWPAAGKTDSGRLWVASGSRVPLTVRV